MPKIVALDIGDARIGVAASDESFIIASPYQVVNRSKSIKADVGKIETLIYELEALEVVIGLPLNNENEEGPQALKIRDFGERLSRRIKGIDVTYFDERFSTMDADEIMLNKDTSRSKRKAKIDSVAAAVILQRYLESKRK